MFVQQFLHTISIWLAALTSDLRDMGASYIKFSQLIKYSYLALIF